MERSDTRVTADELEKLVAAGAIRQFTLEAIGQGFAVVANLKNGTRAVLRTFNDDKTREFRDPRRALDHLRELGITQALIDFTKWDREQGEVPTTPRRKA